MTKAFSRIIVGLSAVACATAMQPAHAVPATPAAAAEELLDADRDFSAAGADDNIADAIGAMMAPNALMPTPQGNFAKGKEGIIAALQGNPANANATAEWAPVRAGVSADGLHGFTYGFMTIHIPNEPDRRAKYLAYWAKRPEGWRVVGYKRAGSPPGDVSTALRVPALPPVMIHERPSLALRSKYQSSLGAREKAFSDRAQVVGLRQAFLEFGSSDAMNMGPGSDFLFGNGPISEGLPPDVPPGLTWAADEQVTVATTGDLGVTFGYIKFDGGGQIPFFTVWRRPRTSDPWLYVAE